MRPKPNEVPIAEKAAITQIQTSHNYLGLGLRHKNTSLGFRPKFFSRTVFCINTVNLLLSVTLGEKL